MFQVLFHQYSISPICLPNSYFCECDARQVSASVCTKCIHITSLLHHSLPYSFETEPFIEPRDNWYPASKVQQSSCLCPIKCQDYRHGHTQFLHGYWDLNSDSYTCTLSTLKWSISPALLFSILSTACPLCLYHHYPQPVIIVRKFYSYFHLHTHTHTQNNCFWYSDKNYLSTNF